VMPKFESQLFGIKKNLSFWHHTRLD